MSENLRKKIVFATLPLAILWAVLNYPSGKTPSQTTAPQAVPRVELPRLEPFPGVQATPTPAIDIKAKQEDAWGDDPFKSHSSRSRGTTQSDRESGPLEWALAGIIYSENKPLAFVNNHMVGVGDKVGAATVVAISRESVTLDCQGRMITLKLHKG